MSFFLVSTAFGSTLLQIIVRPKKKYQGSGFLLRLFLYSYIHISYWFDSPNPILGCKILIPFQHLFTFRISNLCTFFPYGYLGNVQGPFFLLLPILYPTTFLLGSRTVTQCVVRVMSIKSDICNLRPINTSIVNEDHCCYDTTLS